MVIISDFHNIFQYYRWEPDLLFAGFPISRITLPPIDASKFTFEESSTAYGPVDCDFMDDPLTKVLFYCANFTP